METVDWRAFIHADPAIMTGKPVIKGTRLTVEFLLGLFAAGWSREQMLEGHPHLTTDAISAIFEYAAECVADQRLVTRAAEVA